MINSFYANKQTFCLLFGQFKPFAFLSTSSIELISESSDMEMEYESSRYLEMDDFLEKGRRIKLLQQAAGTATNRCG
jgi:hypothetical protein